MKILTTFVILALSLISGPALAADQGTAYGAVLDQFDTITEQFTSVIGPAAKSLFWKLVIIDIAIFGLKVKKGRIEDAPEKLAWRILFYGFIFAVMNFSWLLDICQSFAILGMKGAGLSSFNPADQMREGLNLIAQMVNKYNSDAGGSFAILKNPFAAITMGLCVVLTLISYMILVAQYLVITLQMNIYATIAPLLLALGGLTYTKDVSLKVMSTSIVIGVRMMVIFFVLSFAKSMTPLIGADIAKSTIDNILPLLSAVSMAGLLAILAMKAPTLATDLLNGTSSLSAGDAMLPGTAAVAGATAGAIAGGLSSAGGAVAGAAKDGVMSVKEALAGFTGGASSNGGGLSGMTSNYNPSTGSGGPGSGSASSLPGMGGTNTPSDLNPSWFSDPTSSASSGSGSTNAVSDQPSSGGSITGAGQASPTVAPSSQGGSISGSSDYATTSSAGGGTIGGANASGQASQPNNSAVADHVSRGLQEFAQAEKSAGASVNIQLGHEEI
jgi:type IV secretion system protein TrbL